jgi:hypothetical protein
MHISNTLGQDWTEEDPGDSYEDSNSWRALDMNQDGSKLIVAGYNNAYITSASAPQNQNTVSLSSAEGGKTITLTTPEGTTITCHSAVKESNLSCQRLCVFTFHLAL